MRAEPAEVLVAEAAAARPLLRVRNLGRVAYSEAMRIQDELLAQRIGSDAAGGEILLLEHEPVYTLGRGADLADLMGVPERLGVPVFRVGRGGGATFHGPGQVVAYPIVRLPGHGRDVRRYIRRLESALVRTCGACGVVARAIPAQTGVWAAGGKVAAIGIGVRRGVAFHGVSLNVCNRVDYFEQIVPCRTPGMAVTTLQREIGESAGSVVLPAIDVIARALAAEIASALNMELVEVAR